MAAVQPRERRLILLAGVVVLILAANWYVVEPMMDRRERVQTLIEARQALLDRQERLVARRAGYVREHEALRGEVARRRAQLLPGDKAPLAASELQKLVKSTAQQSGVEVRSERVLPTTTRGGYSEVPVEITLSGPIRGIVSFLHQLDGAPMLLTIQDVKLRVVSVGAPREILATVAMAGYIATGADAPRATGSPRT